MPSAEAPSTPIATEVPLYTPWDAARYLHIPVWAVLAMLGRGRFHPEWFFDRHWWREIEIEDERPRLSIRQLAALFVRSALIHAAGETGPAKVRHPERWFRHHEHFWMALEIRPDQDVLDPVAASRFVERVVDRAADVDAERLQKSVLLYLDRVDVLDGTPHRVFPFSRDPGPTAPRSVVLNPRVRFGRPTLAGRGVPTDVIIERFRGGDSSSELAEDYGITTAEVDEAIRYETRTQGQSFPPFFGW